jgi:bifunctional DNA-binding transcriptional regulator/antitoxin component of YhaV-PrlF toxin-antitoxin module
MRGITMPEVRLRPKGQVTIPASIIEKAHLSDDAMLDIQLINGVITLTPQSKPNQREDIMAFAGIFQGAWGDTPAMVDKTISDLRDEWER